MSGETRDYRAKKLELLNQLVHLLKSPPQTQKPPQGPLIGSQVMVKYDEENDKGVKVSKYSAFLWGFFS